MSQGVVCIRERYHFGVGERAVAGLDDVYPDGDELPCLGFEHCCAERSASLGCDVGQRESDGESHAITSR